MDNFSVNELTDQEDVRQRRKALLTDAAKLGSLLLAYELMQNFFARAYYYVTYYIFAKKFTLDWEDVRTYWSGRTGLLNSTSFKMTLCISVTLLCLLLTVLLGRVVFKIGAKEYIRPGAKNFKLGAKWFPACYLANMVFSLVCSMLIVVLNNKGVTVPEADLSIKSPSVMALTVQFLYTVVMAPIVEEYIYRGIILGTLAKYNKGAAILLSALSFALMHGNIPQAVSAFATGLIYATIAVRCGSIIPTMVIHVLNNVCAGFDDFAGVLGIPHYKFISSVVVIVLGVLGLLIFCLRYKQLRIPKYDDEVLPEKKSRQYIWLNPMIVIYLGYLAYYIIHSLITINS